jgi:P27 family predicted phage terminase small subunit
MGRRGRPKEPVEAKLARGETRPSRVNYAAPVVPDRGPVMPADMTQDAKTVWARVMRATRGAGIVKAADHDVLRAYCEAAAEYKRVRRLLAASSPLLTRDGELVRNPLYIIIRQERDAVRLLARELGLSPAARSGLYADLDDGPDGGIDAELPPSPRALVAMAGGRSE